MDTTGTFRGLLALPPELRELIYELLVVKPRNTITMLSNHDCHRSEVSAAQPGISRVCHLLRIESLSTFYNSNLFLAEVSDRTDLATAKRWLSAIGSANVGCLRNLALCGWSRVPFGHMVCRRWIRIVLDLKEGTMEIEGNATEADRHPHVMRSIEELKKAYREMVEARAGRRFDVESVASLMDGFNALCTAY